MQHQDGGGSQAASPTGPAQGQVQGPDGQLISAAEASVELLCNDQVEWPDLANLIQNLVEFGDIQA